MAEFNMMIADPNAAFLLITFGVYGVILEATNPGGIIPGAFGAICFILGIFSLNMLPVDYTGLGLMGLGIVFMASEAFIPSFGALGIIGAGAFAVGGSMLVDEEVYGSGVSWWVIGITSAITLGTILYIMNIYVKARKSPVSTGMEGLKNSIGEIKKWSGNKGEILASGTIWQAESKSDYKFKKGDEIQIANVDGVYLIIEPVTKTKEN